MTRPGEPTDAPSPADPEPLEYANLPFRSGRLLPGDAAWQRVAFRIIFGHHTTGGLVFDAILLALIGASTIAVMLETVESIDNQFHGYLYAVEWLATILFSIEYVVRIACLKTKRKYAWSFFGVVDLVAILPTYLSLFLMDAQTLAVVRALRLLRIFRIFKLARFIREGAELRASLWAARAKITVFLLTVLIVVTIIGSAMYLVEGRVNHEQFGNIPDCIYWAIVTVATVGYGDIAPVTPVGKFLTAILIIFGYSLIVVPTGIITAEMGNRKKGVDGDLAQRHCGDCGHEEPDPAAHFCKYCGAGLEPPVAV